MGQIPRKDKQSWFDKSWAYEKMGPNGCLGYIGDDISYPII